MPPAQYVELLQAEIRLHANDLPQQSVDSVYFGGGTPSLFPPKLILTVLEELANHGFKLRPGAEVTIEINPGTLTEVDLEEWLKIGVTRFSVGAQTFDDRLLKIAGRKHNRDETVATLQLLKNQQVNYSFDLLFALPTQTLPDVKKDVLQALNFDPSHLSAYCLTLPENHPMQKGRAPDEEQVEMFDVIESELAQAGLERYEISNFARPGRESRHNVLYWSDQEYWGLGVSAHSFLKKGKWGARFWNAPSLPAYEKQLLGESGPWSFAAGLPPNQYEGLELHQAIFDFSHTFLRMKRGLSSEALRLKFGGGPAQAVENRLKNVLTKGLVKHDGATWALTREGRLVANVVFEQLTFLKDELSED